MNCAIRKAEPADAAGASVALRRSIKACCRLDHNGDQAILDAWLRNKTEETVRAWIDSTTKFVLVAEIEGAVAGVGMLDLSGEIELCYLVSEARFQGVGKAMLSALENEARRLGLAALELVSTRTSHAFYVRNGYVDTGDEVDCFGLRAPRMRKAISDTIAE